MAATISFLISLGDQLIFYRQHPVLIQLSSQGQVFSTEVLGSKCSQGWFCFPEEPSVHNYVVPTLMANQYRELLHWQSFKGFSLDSEENTLPPPTSFFAPYPFYPRGSLVCLALPVITALTISHFTQTLHSSLPAALGQPDPLFLGGPWVGSWKGSLDTFSHNWTLSHRCLLTK